MSPNDINLYPSPAKGKTATLNAIPKLAKM